MAKLWNENETIRVWHIYPRLVSIKFSIEESLTKWAITVTVTMAEWKQPFSLSLTVFVLLFNCRWLNCPTELLFLLMQWFTELLDDNLIWYFIYATIKYNFNAHKGVRKVEKAYILWLHSFVISIVDICLLFFFRIIVPSHWTRNTLSFECAHSYTDIYYCLIHRLHNFQVFIFNGNVFRMTIPNGIEEMNGSTKHLNEIHRCPFQVRCVRQQPCKSRKYIWQNYGLYCSSNSHLYMYLLWSKHLVFMIAVIFISDAQVE